jgi:hypothetical protein
MAVFPIPIPLATELNTTAPLTGGGDLSDGLTIAMPAATASDNGYLLATDHVIFSAKASAASVTALDAATEKLANKNINNGYVGRDPNGGIQIAGGIYINTNANPIALRLADSMDNGLVQVTATGINWYDGANETNLGIEVGDNSLTFNSGDVSVQNLFATTITIGGKVISVSSGSLKYSTDTATAGILLENTNAGNSGSMLNLYHNSASPASSDATGIINFTGKSSTGVVRTYAQIQQVTATTTNGSEQGLLQIQTMQGGTLSNSLLLSSNGIVAYGYMNITGDLNVGGTNIHLYDAEQDDTRTIHLDDNTWSFDGEISSNGGVIGAYLLSLGTGVITGQLDCGSLEVGVGSRVAKVHVFTSTASDGITIENTNAGASGSLLNLYHNSASPAGNDSIGTVNYSGKDSAGNETIYAQIKSLIQTTTNSSEAGELVFSTMKAGTLTEAFRVDESANVGVGIANPLNKLHVYSTTNADGICVEGTQNPGYSLKTGGVLKGFFGGLVTGAGSYLTDSAVDDIAFRVETTGKKLLFTNAADQLTTTFSIGGGSVGVNTRTTNSCLHVKSSGAAAITAILQGATSQSADLLQINNSVGTTFVSVNSSGITHAKGMCVGAVYAAPYSNRFKLSQSDGAGTGAIIEFYNGTHAMYWFLDAVAGGGAGHIRTDSDRHILLQNNASSSGGVGVGTEVGSVAAKLDVSANTTLTKVLRLATPQTSGDSVIEDTIQSKITTTNASWTYATLATAASNYSYIVESTVIARRTGGASGTNGDMAGYKLQRTFNNIGGTLTSGYTLVTELFESQTAWTADINHTGTTIRLAVLGATNNNITWHATTKIYPLGS